MITMEPPAVRPDQPGAVGPDSLGPLRALAGVVAALAAVGVGHGVAGLLNPPPHRSSPSAPP